MIEVSIGRVVRGIVAGHHPYGVEVRLLPPDRQVLAFVDVAAISDDQQINGPEGFPPVGTEVSAVTLRYDGNGQLRLSLRRSDIDPRNGNKPLGEHNK